MEFSDVKDLLGNILFIWQEGYEREKTVCIWKCIVIYSSELQGLVFILLLELIVLRFVHFSKKSMSGLHYKACETLCKSQDIVLVLVLRVTHKVSN